MSKDNYLERIAEKIERCRDKYPDGMREYQKRYYQENKEKRRAYGKAYIFPFGIGRLKTDILKVLQ